VIALPGIDSYSASSGACAIVMPPAALTARTPSVPSDPVPERMIPSDRDLCALASVSRNTSTVIGRPRCLGAWVGSSLPSSMRSSELGEIT